MCRVLQKYYQTSHRFSLKNILTRAFGCHGRESSQPLYCRQGQPGPEFCIGLLYSRSVAQQLLFVLRGIYAILVLFVRR